MIIVFFTSFFQPPRGVIKPFEEAPQEANKSNSPTVWSVGHSSKSNRNLKISSQIVISTPDSSGPYITPDNCSPNNLFQTTVV